jgi:hypothetical protein
MWKNYTHVIVLDVFDCGSWLHGVDGVLKNLKRRKIIVNNLDLIKTPVD